MPVSNVAVARKDFGCIGGISMLGLLANMLFAERSGRATYFFRMDALFVETTENRKAYNMRWSAVN